MYNGSRFTNSRKRYTGAHRTSFLFRRFIGCCYKISATKCIKIFTLLKFLYLLSFVTCIVMLLVSTFVMTISFPFIQNELNALFDKYANRSAG